MSQLLETAVRLEAQNSLDEIVREVRIKEAELDKIVRERSETIEKLEGEIGRLVEQKDQLKTEIQVHSNGNSGSKASESDTIGRARQKRTTKKQEAMQQLLEVFRKNPNATLSKLAKIIDHLVKRSRQLFPISSRCSTITGTGIQHLSIANLLIYQRL